MAKVWVVSEWSMNTGFGEISEIFSTKEGAINFLEELSRMKNSSEDFNISEHEVYDGEVF